MTWDEIKWNQNEKQPSNHRIDTLPESHTLTPEIIIVFIVCMISFSLFFSLILKNLFIDQPSIRNVFIVL